MFRGLSKSALILGGCVGLGLTLGGFFIGRAIGVSKYFDRYVTVRGLAEKDVPADLAIWPVAFRVMENDLSKLQFQVQKNRLLTRRFLIAAGFDAAEISNPPIQITDFEARDGGEEKNARNYRYMAQVTVLLRTPKVALAKETMEKSDKLVQQGVALTGAEDFARPVEFLFTGLNAIKPAMIEEANRNAREAANKFAKDSGSRVGGIRRAVQGAFEINDRDSSSRDMKSVRVVTTIDYFLR